MSQPLSGSQTEQSIISVQIGRTVLTTISAFLVVLTIAPVSPISEKWSEEEKSAQMFQGNHHSVMQISQAALFNLFLRDLPG